jgi:hypothetical protein
MGLNGHRLIQELTMIMNNTATEGEKHEKMRELVINL